MMQKATEILTRILQKASALLCPDFCKFTNLQRQSSRYVHCCQQLFVVYCVWHFPPFQRL